MGPMPLPLDNEAPLNNEAIASGIFQVNLHFRRRLNQALRAHGVSLARIKTLKYIEFMRGDARAADIAELFDQTPHAVTDMLDGLEREGLIGRAVDSKDRRVKRLHMTDSGHAALIANEPLLREVMDEAFRILQPAQKAQFYEVLSVLIDHLSSV